MKNQFMGNNSTNNIDTETTTTNSNIKKKVKIRVKNLKNLTLKRLNLKDPENRTWIKKKFISHLGKVGVAALSLALTTSLYSSAATAVDNSTIAVNNEAAKSVLDQALKVSRSKPALSLATVITCLAAAGAAGAAASPALCVACGILIAKTIG